MLNLLEFAKDLRVVNKKGKVYIECLIRRKEVVLQPEEMVRQCVLIYLLQTRGISRNLIKVEKGIKVNNLYKRCDILVYDRNAVPILLIECKRPSQLLTQKVFDQIAIYNMPMKVPLLMVTNGETNYFCRIDFENGKYAFLDQLPDEIA